MVHLSSIAGACAEREAAKTDEERTERERNHKKTLERIAKQHGRMPAPVLEMERFLAPMRGFESVVAPLQAMEKTLAPLRALRDAVDWPGLHLGRKLATSPVVGMAQEWADSPAARVARTLAESPALEAARKLTLNLPTIDMLRFDFPELAGVDRLRGLARGLEHDVLEGPSFGPEMFRPIRSARDVHQDQRFEQLTTVVVAQTDQVVELRREVREVKESAARDSHRERAQTIRRDRVGARLQWWHLVVASVLSAVLGAVASKLIGAM